MANKEKRALFESIWRLDEGIDEDESQHGATQLMNQFQPLSRKQSKGESRHRTSASGNISESETRANLPVSNKEMPPPRAPVVTAKTPPPQMDITFTSKPQISAPPTRPRLVSDQLTISKKRKRDDILNYRPESQQIFKDCYFYFLPNNDVAGPRRLRIKRSMEWGAAWIKDWKEGITHVILDSDLTYQYLIGHLKGASLLDGVIVVNDKYPPDCIHFGYLLKPDQFQYRVKGAPKDNDIQTGIIRAPKTPVLADVSSRKEMRTPPITTPSPAKSVMSLIDSNARSPISTSTDASGGGVAATIDRSEDALDTVIKETKRTASLPIDLFEEGNSSESHDSTDDGDNESAKSSYAGREAWRQNFICMSKSDGTDSSRNPNSRTIEVLSEMLKYYEQTKDQWRSIAYRKAISALRREKGPVLTAEEALAIPSIGRRLANKIEEIVLTNRLRRLESTNLELHTDALRLFLKIYGVGYRQATAWVGQGYRTLDDLLKSARLSENQKIGIAHLEDFQTRIPRQEIDKHDAFVRSVTTKYAPEMQVTVGGSYRRGAKNSGDIDFIVTKPNTPLASLGAIVKDSIIPSLFRKGYLQAKLSASSKYEGRCWHGAATLPGTTVWRRVDFLIVPWDELGAALIYFTGNDIFNRSMRLLASKMDMRLNERGLWKDVIRGTNRERLTQGTLIEGKDERKIFDILNVPWRPPEHREC